MYNGLVLTSKYDKEAVVADKKEEIEIPLVLEKVLSYCLKDAKERMEKGEVVLPFSALAVGETLFMELHDADTVDESFASVRKLVSNATGAQAYGFCYDGFIEADDHKQYDCLIAQGGVPGGEYGHAIGWRYRVDDDGKAVFRGEPIYVGNCLNYMQGIEDFTSDEGEEAAEEEAAE
jgi:hypothetical protein